MKNKCVTPVSVVEEKRSRERKIEMAGKAEIAILYKMAKGN